MAIAPRVNPAAAFAAAGAVMPKATAPPFNGEADYLVQRLRAALGINPLPVRQAPWQAPPLFAEPVEWRCSAFIGGTGDNTQDPQVWQVQWNAINDPADFGGGVSNYTLTQTLVASPWPRGFIGVVWVDVRAQQRSLAASSAFNVMRSVRWTLTKNNAPINGFMRQAPGGNAGLSYPLLAQSNTNETGTITTVQGCPIQMYQNETMAIAFHVDSNVAVGNTVEFEARVYGYRFPVAESIQGQQSFAGVP